MTLSTFSMEGMHRTSTGSSLLKFTLNVSFFQMFRYLHFACV